MSEAKTFRIRVHGNALTGIVREIADRGDVAGVLNALSGMSTDHALAIIERRSKLEGYSDGTDDAPGIEIVDDEPDRPADVYEFTKKFFERKGREERSAGFDDGVEAVSRWLSAEGHSTLSESLECGTWEDPGEE